MFYWYNSSYHVVFIIKFIDFWVIAHFEVSWPHELAKFSCAFKIFLVLKLSIRITCRLIQLDADPVAFWLSSDFSNILNFSSLGSNVSLASLPYLNLVSFFFLVISIEFTHIALEIGICLELSFPELTVCVFSFIIVCITHYVLFYLRYIFELSIVH